MFQLKSKYKPTGDQPKAIQQLKSFIQAGYKYQTLWWVTGSGKTFTMANIIEDLQKPTLIIAHNKTLAAQLAQEFKEFFPDAAVHYFVSYYDYYQPEAYVSKTDTYIEKEATINEEIDRLRHAATQSLLTRKDVIIVASVSCIYGIGDIDAYIDATFDIKVGGVYKTEDLLKQLVTLQYKRAGADFKPGNFQIMGDLLEIFPASEETVYSIEFWGDEVSQITRRNYLTGEIYEFLQEVEIFPAKHTVTSKETIERVLPQIKADLAERLAYFESEWDVLKYERLKAKVEYDIEMMQEVGYVNGIENYSRYLDGRNPGDPAQVLIDFFPEWFLCFIDESHMTLPQIGGMYNGDRARKENLVNNGFRLPAALDNRPLKFDEFESKLGQMVCVSATPSVYEIEQSSISGAKKEKGKKYWFELFQSFDPIWGEVWKPSVDNRVVDLVIRPTGLLDPVIEIKPMEFMVDDIMEQIDYVISKNERLLVTTITKRSSEELCDYLLWNGVKVRYLHSEIETLERLEILRDLRMGKIDVIVWVNLLREGLDLPEVSRICILDADKQGFLRSEPSLIQIIGRAARNSDGKVTMYTEKLRLKGDDWGEKTIIELGNFEKYEIVRIDKGKWLMENWQVVSESMKKAIHLTYYRRKIQNEYNIKHGIDPTTIISSIKEVTVKAKKKDYTGLDSQSIEKEIKRLELEMDVASANLEFEKAAEVRDQLIELKRGKKGKRG
jgi:excinuclease ABC subunit B